MFSEFTGPHSDVYRVKSNVVQNFLNQEVSSSGLVESSLKLGPTVHHTYMHIWLCVHMFNICTCILVNFKDC